MRERGSLRVLRERASSLRQPVHAFSINIPEKAGQFREVMTACGPEAFQVSRAGDRTVIVPAAHLPWDRPQYVRAVGDHDHELLQMAQLTTCANPACFELDAEVRGVQCVGESIDCVLVCQCFLPGVRNESTEKPDGIVS